MHEYAITKELLRIARETAREKGITDIREIVLELGILSGYEKESINYYFDELKIGGDYLANAKLTITEIPTNEIKIVGIDGDLDNLSLNAKNDEIAKRINKILREKGIFCINIMGAPGSGKTTLIEGLSNFLDGIFVLQGDLKSDVDKIRLEKARIGCFQINTHSGCHLNAPMIEEALKNIDFGGKKFLIIENVGNLVCPAGVKIGQDINLVVNSVTEGNDKPEKYPLIFRDSQAVILSKYDLKEAVEFDEEEYIERLRKVTTAPVFRISKKDEDSFKEVAGFIDFKKTPRSIAA